MVLWREGAPQTGSWGHGLKVVMVGVAMVLHHEGAAIKKRNIFSVLIRQLPLPRVHGLSPAQHHRLAYLIQ